MGLILYFPCRKSSHSLSNYSGPNTFDSGGLATDSRQNVKKQRTQLNLEEGVASGLHFFLIAPKTKSSWGKCKEGPIDKLYSLFSRMMDSK